MKLLRDYLFLLIIYLPIILKIICKVDDLCRLEVLLELKRKSFLSTLAHILYVIKVLIFEAFHFLK
jgi:hypothetical protein